MPGFRAQRLGCRVCLLFKSLLPRCVFVCCGKRTVGGLVSGSGLRNLRVVLYGFERDLASVQWVSDLN